MARFIFTIAVILFVVVGIHGDKDKCSQERRGSRLVDQDFGIEMAHDDLLTSMFSPLIYHDYFRPWRHMEALRNDLGSTIKTDKDKFQINLDVQHFSPDEITVKTSDGFVVIEAKHEDKKDEHGFVSRQFVRRYALPEGAESDNVVSQLSSDGILTVTAPRKEIDAKGERVVQITQTGPVRKESKEDTEGSCHTCNA